MDVVVREVEQALKAAGQDTAAQQADVLCGSSDLEAGEDQSAGSTSSRIPKQPLHKKTRLGRVQQLQAEEGCTLRPLAPQCSPAVQNGLAPELGPALQHATAPQPSKSNSSTQWSQAAELSASTTAHVGLPNRQAGAEQESWESQAPGRSVLSEGQRVGRQGLLNRQAAAHQRPIGRQAAAHQAELERQGAAHQRAAEWAAVANLGGSVKTAGQGLQPLAQQVHDRQQASQSHAQCQSRGA